MFGLTAWASRGAVTVVLALSAAPAGAQPADCERILCASDPAVPQAKPGPSVVRGGAPGNPPSTLPGTRFTLPGTRLDGITRNNQNLNLFGHGF